MKLYPATDQLSMVPINGSEDTSLVLINSAYLMPLRLLGRVNKKKSGVGVSIPQPLMVNYWDLDLDCKVLAMIE